MKVPPVTELRRVCQPPDLDVCIFRRLLTRRVSIHFTRFFLLCGVSANAVSALKGVIACAGSLLFITGVIAPGSVRTRNEKGQFFFIIRFAWQIQSHRPDGDDDSPVAGRVVISATEGW